MFWKFPSSVQMYRKQQEVKISGKTEKMHDREGGKRLFIFQPTSGYISHCTCLAMVDLYKSMCACVHGARKPEAAAGG